jgi:hypothetical protein
MRLRYSGLDAGQFQSLFTMDAAALAARSAVRVTAEPGSPCRITLEDAEPGESLLLLCFEHQRAASPYRSSGPIFLREIAVKTYESDVPPPVFRSRTLSLRAYDAAGMMLEAELVEGRDAPAACARLLAPPEIVYLHAHYATRGCYAARIERG